MAHPRNNGEGIKEMVSIFQDREGGGAVKEIQLSYSDSTTVIVNYSDSTCKSENHGSNLNCECSYSVKFTVRSYETKTHIQIYNI